MLKITKGLKKKKKGKKNKNKEEDLFDSAELEQYRREQQQKQETGIAETSELVDSEKGEEWEKFKALTSGVDDILKKTQGDLDRIKSTSYFQKKTPGTSSSATGRIASNESGGAEIVKAEVLLIKEKWVGFEDSVVNLEDEESEKRQEELVKQEEPKEEEEEVVVVVEEAEEEESELEDDQDDIFDTSYVDVVASGEVKLAYVPDSPIKEEEDSFDPFDTSIVDKVIKAVPKKKNLVNLGCAVEVLTGKLEKFSSLTDSGKAQKRRHKTQDLLLDSFDEDYISIRADREVAVTVVDSEPASKSILDDDPVFAEETSAILEFPSVIHNCENNKPFSSQLEEKKEKSPELDLKHLVEEFVCKSHSTPEPPASKENVELVVDDELDDEFAALAAESLAKTHKEITNKPAKPPRPELPPKGSPTATEVELQYDEFETGEDDPFDTSFAAQILPGKFELKLIEKEILTDNNININSVENGKSTENPNINIQFINSAIKETFVFPANEPKEQEPLSLKHRDLLGGSTTDLSKISQCPIVPKSIEINVTDLVNDDPFDTSIVNELVAPGKTELKFLEKELLTEGRPELQIEVDNDFDPRAEDTLLVTKPVSRPDNLKVSGGKRTSVPKIVAFDLKSPSSLPDLLAIGPEENAKINKPLTPYYPPSNNVSLDKNDLDSSIDPFDTSFVTNYPGKLELKLIEQELTSGSAELKRSLSDPDFDPRAKTETDHDNQPTISNNLATPGGSETVAISEQPDIISEEVKIEAKLHTPVTPRKITQVFEEIQDFDPFDTSITNVLAPGKVEVKILETELIFAKEISPVNTINNKITDTLTRQFTDSIRAPVTDVLEQISEEITVKPLTPTAASSLDQEEIDPFDTSCVGHILPGKTEIKLLESELLS